MIDDIRDIIEKGNCISKKKEIIKEGIKKLADLQQKELISLLGE